MCYLSGACRPAANQIQHDHIGMEHTQLSDEKHTIRPLMIDEHIMTPISYVVYDHRAIIYFLLLAISRIMASQRRSIHARFLYSPVMASISSLLDIHGTDDDGGGGILHRLGNTNKASFTFELTCVYTTIVDNINHITIMTHISSTKLVSPCNGEAALIVIAYLFVPVAHHQPKGYLETLVYMYPYQREVLQHYYHYQAPWNCD